MLPILTDVAQLDGSVLCKDHLAEKGNFVALGCHECDVLGCGFIVAHAMDIHEAGALHTQFLPMDVHQVQKSLDILFLVFMRDVETTEIVPLLFLLY